MLQGNYEQPSKAYKMLFSGMVLLKATGVWKSIHDNTIVDETSFELLTGEKLAIAGETGSGKTTLLKMIGGLEQPSGGFLQFEEESIKGPLDQLIPGHKGIAYLSQHFELRNNYRIEEVLSYSDQLPDGKASQIYRVCEIEHLLKRKTDQLSGGERQRVALARLLITSPRLLLLDEPFSNLDRGHKQIIKNVIRELSEELGITCILVSHDSVDLLSWADRILVLQNGHLIQDADPRTIYFKPVNEYCASLFGDYNLIETGGDKRLFARTECLDVFEHSTQATHLATVIRSGFNGNHYLIELEYQQQRLLVQRNRPIRNSAVVSVSFARAGDWYL